KLKAITAPVLLLQGRQDLAGEADICEAHSLIKNSTLAFIDKCGHMPWLEQPEQTWKIVDDFLGHLPSILTEDNEENKNSSRVFVLLFPSVWGRISPSSHLSRRG